MSGLVALHSTCVFHTSTGLICQEFLTPLVSDHHGPSSSLSVPPCPQPPPRIAQLPWEHSLLQISPQTPNGLSNPALKQPLLCTTSLFQSLLKHWLGQTCKSIPSTGNTSCKWLLEGFISLHSAKRKRVTAEKKSFRTVPLFPIHEYSAPK